MSTATAEPCLTLDRCVVNFLWMMAANRETEDRLFGVVNVHQGFKQGGSGLEAGRAGK